VPIRFVGPGAKTGRRTVLSYSGAQYAWRADGARGRPGRETPPRRSRLAPGAVLEVPPYSLTVVR